MAGFCKTILVICFMGMFLTASLAEEIPSRPNRKLLQPIIRGSETRAANNLRAQAATSEAIQEAVRFGGNPAFTRRAGRVGNMMAWAAAQNDPAVMRQAEKWAEIIPPSRTSP